MSRHDRHHLDDVSAAIGRHLQRGDLGPVVAGRRSQVEGRRSRVVVMRDRLAHSYFDTSHVIVAATVREDLPLLSAIDRLAERAGPDRNREPATDL